MGTFKVEHICKSIGRKSKRGKGVKEEEEEEEQAKINAVYSK